MNRERLVHTIVDRTFLDLVSNPRLLTSLSKCIYNDSHQLMLYSTVITKRSSAKMQKTCRVILGLGNTEFALFGLGGSQVEGYCSN